jgi:hypothetical protein
LTTIPRPIQIVSDGADLWVASHLGTVARVRASDGRLLETWTGADSAWGILVATGRVLVSEQQDFSGDGRLYMIDPSQPPGAVTTVVSALGGSRSLVFDGSRAWAAHGFPGPPSVSIVTPEPSIPWTTTTVTSGAFHFLLGMIFDGSNVWVTDATGTDGWLLKLDGNGSVLQTITIDTSPGYPAFDGSNIWVPRFSGVSVVRAATGTVLATLTDVRGGISAAFDGQRVLVTAGTGGVSLYKAADLALLGTSTFGFGFDTYNVCSDGVNFWLTLGDNWVGRF